MTLAQHVRATLRPAVSRRQRDIHRVWYRTELIKLIQSTTSTNKQGSLSNDDRSLLWGLWRVSG